MLGTSGSCLSLEPLDHTFLLNHSFVHTVGWKLQFSFSSFSASQLLLKSCVMDVAMPISCVMFLFLLSISPPLSLLLLLSLLPPLLSSPSPFLPLSSPPPLLPLSSPSPLYLPSPSLPPLLFSSSSPPPPLLPSSPLPHTPTPHAGPGSGPGSGASGVGGGGVGGGGRRIISDVPPHIQQLLEQQDRQAFERGSPSRRPVYRKIIGIPSSEGLSTAYIVPGLFVSHP